MRNYLITHKKSKLSMLFTFDLNDYLIEFKSNFKMTKDRLDFLRDTLPWFRYDLKKYEDSGVWRVDEIKQDLTFVGFWNEYCYKKGNKARSERLWNQLNSTQKAKAINYIKRYNNDLLLTPGIQRLYPETYLSQKRYDNE